MKATNIFTLINIRLHEHWAKDERHNQKICSTTETTLRTHVRSKTNQMQRDYLSVIIM